VIEFRLGAELGVENPAAGPGGTGEQLRQAVIGLRTDHQVDEWCARQNLRPFG